MFGTPADLSDRRDAPDRQQPGGDTDGEAKTDQLDDTELVDDAHEPDAAQDLHSLAAQLQELGYTISIQPGTSRDAEPSSASGGAGRKPPEPTAGAKPAGQGPHAARRATHRDLEVVEVPLLPNGKLYAKTVSKLRRLSGHDGSGRTIRYWVPYMEAAGYRIVAEGHRDAASARGRGAPAARAATDSYLETVEVPLDPSGKLYVKTVGKLRRLSGHKSQARTVNYWQPHMRRAGYRLVVRR